MKKKMKLRRPRRIQIGCAFLRFANAKEPFKLNDKNGFNGFAFKRSEATKAIKWLNHAIKFMDQK